MFKKISELLQEISELLQEIIQNSTEVFRPRCVIDNSKKKVRPVSWEGNGIDMCDTN